MQKLYNTLLEAVNSQEVSGLPEVRLTIEGDFSTQRIAELERELEEYRSGVNASVDRRVREIVREYTSMEEMERGAVAPQTPPSHEHHQHNYNIKVKREGGRCKKCEQNGEIE